MTLKLVDVLVNAVVANVIADRRKLGARHRVLEVVSIILFPVECM